MITLIAPPLRFVACVVAAAFVVAFGLLAMDQGYVAAAPHGVIEVGELQLIELAEPGEPIAPMAPAMPEG